MILVKFPSRERPETFRKVLSEWVRLADDIHGLHFLFSFDKDDHTMRDATPFIQELYINATVCYGSSASKVEAINRDIERVKKWRYVLVISDDMWPVVKGWDSTIREAFTEHFPDGDGLLWFFDGKQRDICTLPLMGRAYYDRTGYIYNPIYRSVFCDDEQTHIAQALGRLVFRDNVLAEHHHPANFSHVKPDALYRRNETTAIWQKDSATYKRRKAQGFP